MDMNVVVAGHVDHGKSTLIGRLLYDSGSIKEGQVEEIQKLAEEFKRRFEFAYFIDAFDDELKEERTIDTISVMFKGKNLYTVIDVPGHKEFLKNMLTGASHADAAVLVVAAGEGIQEQTSRHIFLIHMLGIKHLLVVVNKMDAVDYSQEVFSSVKNEIARILTPLGYRNVPFIPASAMTGDNVYQRSERIRWYRGPSLIQALDKVGLTREVKPLRFAVQDIYLVDSQKVVVGRVESGAMRKGDEVIFAPSNIRGKIEGIKIFQKDLEVAKMGDSVGIVTDCQPRRGDVCGLVESPPKPTQQFLGEAIVLQSIRQAEVLEIRVGTRKVKGQIEEIRERIDSESGEVLERHSSFIKENEAATIRFVTEPLVIEKFSDIPPLGRFVLARDNRNIGAGVVLEATP